MSTENLDAKGLDELERLMKDATPGPWKPCSASDGMCCCGLIWSVPADVSLLITHVPEDSEEIRPEVNDNAHFIAAAVNAFPELLRLAREGLQARELEEQATYQDDWRSAVEREMNAQNQRHVLKDARRYADHRRERRLASSEESP